MGILDTYAGWLMDRYDNLPHGKYVTLFILRQAESEVIFRTEGSGEDLSKELTIAGRANKEQFPRAVISKRKQTAVERRTGRELLREHNLMFFSNGQKTGKEEDRCGLNRNKPCAACADCMIYGYAVGGGGAQKSRVVTDDAFTILPFNTVTGKRTFNAPYDNGTMRDPVTGEASHSIQSDPYVKPGTLFLDLETLKDVTAGELSYVLGNVLRTRRYGAISSRMGKVRNHLISMAFSDCEMFSNLELTQEVYDRLRSANGELSFPLDPQQVETTMKEAIGALWDEVVGKKVRLHDEETAALVAEMGVLYQDTARAKALLDEITGLY